jgi:hypothetical protein
MTRSELLSEIAIWTEDLWEAESNGWGNSAGECKAALERLYALVSPHPNPTQPNPHNDHPTIHPRIPTQFRSQL